MFLTIAHAATLYYHGNIALILRETDYSNITDKILLDFRENKHKFFTHWCFAAQIVLFALCLAHDFSRLLPERHPVRRAIRYARDLHFTSLAAPMALNVTLIFWSLWTLDRNLVMPETFDAVIPLWMNHALHTNITVLVVVELLAEWHRPPALKPSLAINALVNLLYLYTLFETYLSKGKWLYPVFGILNWPQRIAFMLCIYLASAGHLLAMRAAMRAVWREDKGLQSYYSKVHKD